MKNIISNILGVLIMGVSVYALLKMELAITSFMILISIGAMFFYFENETIKSSLKKIIDKYLKK